jgi:serine/threonine-protein kinase
VTGGASSSSIEKLAMEAVEDAFDLPSNERLAAIAARADLPGEARDLALRMLGADGTAIRTGGASANLPPDQGAAPDLPGYRILRLLGRGGMGAVWLAERTARDFEHKVAIKVVKPGVLLDTMIERFRRERQILAQLNHPHIALLHDGGETAQGQPFIVMEYVDGLTLRDWIAAPGIDLARKLALFLQIADAVEFAHQNLIIHRDLTPGNVLVKDDDQAKLIDFGIASLQVDDGEGTGGSRFTGLSLTPGFAAPERRQGLASNTLTDIYSLGRIVNLMFGALGEPELQAIAAKASADDPADRYAGVGELIEDIERFRRGEPVAAFSHATSYRLRKFVARERALVSVAGAALIGLLIALGVTLWSYGEAERARMAAEQRFADLRELAHYQLFDLYDALDNVVGNTAVRAALAEQSQGYLQQLAESRSDDPQLQLETARGFLRLARIQGLPAAPNLGQSEQARANLDRAEAILRPLVEGGMIAAKSELARLHGHRAVALLHDHNQPDESKASVQVAYDLLDDVPAAQRDWNWLDARRTVRLASLDWADLALDTDGLLRFAGLMDRDLADWPADRREGYEGRFDSARTRYYRAIAAYNLETPAGYRAAQRLFAEADAQYAALERDFPNDPHILYWRAWNAYFGFGNAARLGDVRSETALIEQARASTDQLLLIEANDDSVKSLSRNLKEAQAQFLSNNGRYEEAVVLMEEVLDFARSARAGSPPGTPSRDIAYGTAIMGTIHRMGGNRAAACASFAESTRHIAALRRADQLPGFLERLEAGMLVNLGKCRAGAPVADMIELADAGS